MFFSLTLQPDFLRSTFPRTRHTLEGRWHKVLSHSTTKVTLFSASSQPWGEEQPGDKRPSDEQLVDTSGVFPILKQLAHFFVTAVFWSLMAVIVVILGALFAPKLYYAVVPPDTTHIALPNDTTGNAVVGEGGQSTPLAELFEQKQAYLPPRDETLPEGNWLVIPRIGVRTPLQRTERPEEALATGVWQAPDFAEPGDTSKPIIVAAHRFGWKWWWQSEYWKYHSFYLLPETEVGDRVEIIYDKRRWVYELYAVAEGMEIQDYSADLILYTCKFLNSDIRYVRYARLVVS